MNRLKLYKRTLRQMQINKAFVFFVLVLVIIIIIITYLLSISIPVIETVCDNSAGSIARNISINNVKKAIEATTYDNLADIKQDETGKVTLVTANVMELNRLQTKITSEISKDLNNLGSMYVTIPLSSIFQMGVVSGYGPKVKLNIIPTGSVISNFKSKFTTAGINQTKHTISINIVTKVRLIAPFYTISQEYVNEITIAETIIVGDVPQSYYNIEGVKDIGTLDTTEFIN